MLNLDILGDYCDETQCKYGPFPIDDNDCRFQTPPNRAYKFIEQLREELES
jgi:hypothetical protein